MTDLRQGVTETQHAVLDLIDERAPLWSDMWTADEKLAQGRGWAADATRSKSLNDQRMHAMMAAAILIDAADEIGRLIGDV